MTAEQSTTETDGTAGSPPDHRREPARIEPATPEEFGLVQLWWGDGKGKTTAAMGMGFRAAGHGYRVHMLQFMKGGAGTVEDVRGEYTAIDACPGFTYEHLGEYGWHGMADGSDDADHEAQAQAGLDRASELVEACADSTAGPIPLDGSPDAGCHMLILDEILYAANRSLIDPEEVVSLIDSKPSGLELVLTGGHERPAYATEHADLVTHVQTERHPIDDGQGARKGTEF